MKYDDMLEIRDPELNKASRAVTDQAMLAVVTFLKDKPTCGGMQYALCEHALAVASEMLRNYSTLPKALGECYDALNQFCLDAAPTKNADLTVADLELFVAHSNAVELIVNTAERKKRDLWIAHCINIIEAEPRTWMKTQATSQPS